MNRKRKGLRQGLQGAALLCGALSLAGGAASVMADVPSPKVINPPSAARAESASIQPGRGIGPLRAGMSRAQVEKLLKPAELGEGDVDGKPTLSAYFMSPEKRITLRLDAQGKIIAMILHGDRSIWRDANGVTLGTPLKTLEKLNGRAFRVHAFDGSERAGQIVDWEGGKLAKAFVNATLRFASPLHAAGYAKLDGTQKSELEKPRDFASSDPAMQHLNPVLQTLELAF